MDSRLSGSVLSKNSNVASATGWDPVGNQPRAGRHWLSRCAASVKTTLNYGYRLFMIL